MGGCWGSTSREWKAYAAEAFVGGGTRRSLYLRITRTFSPNVEMSK